MARAGFFVEHFGAGPLSGGRPKEPVLAAHEDATTTPGTVDRCQCSRLRPANNASRREPPSPNLGRTVFSDVLTAPAPYRAAFLCAK